MTDNRQGARDRRQHYADQLALVQLRERIRELEANERAYERIVGRKTYREVAEEAAAQERVRELEAQNTTLRAAQKACEDCDGPTMGAVEEMLRRVRVLEKDAARYRWLKTQRGYVTQADPEKCDAKIDAALTPPKGDT